MTAAVGFGRVVRRQVLLVVSCETLTPDECWLRWPCLLGPTMIAGISFGMWKCVACGMAVLGSV